MRGWCPIVVTHKLCIDQPQVYRTMSCIDVVFWMLQSQVLGQDITRRTLRCFFGHCPPNIYLTSHTWIFLPGIPPPFCILQAIKKLEVRLGYQLASFPGHSQILYCSCGENIHTCEIKSGSGLGTRLVTSMILPCGLVTVEIAAECCDSSGTWPGSEDASAIQD